MKIITRKALSILLTLLIILSAAAFGMTASAEGIFTINGGELTYCNKSAVGAVVVPNTVTKIRSSAFSGCNAITEIKVPSSVTSIGSNAFEACTSLKKVVIEGADCTIGARAFNSCGVLTEIVLPSRLPAINDGAFADCISLKAIVIPSTVTLIGTDAFRMCRSLTSVEIPASVKTIRKNAFIGCTGVTAFSVNGGNTVYSSQGGVLYGPLESSYDPEGTNPVADKTLIKYPSGKTATEFTVPSGILRIGESAFNSDASLKTVSLPSTVKSVEPYAFYMSAISSVAIPSSVTFIGAHAFGSCASLKSVTIPASVTDFTSAFDYSGLTSAVISNGVKTISPRSFDSCLNLASVTISTSVKTIEYGAFNNCPSLKTLRVPASVTSIESGAFNGCDVTFYVENGSYAHTYAQQNSINVKVDGAVTPPPITDRTVKSISVLEKPYKLNYYYKDSVNTDGLVLEVIYTDGNNEYKETVSSGFDISPETVNKVGDIDVAVKFGGKTTSYQISASYAWWQWIIRIILLGFLWY